MQRTNEASKPIHCPSSSTACSLPRTSTILSEINLRRWLVSWKILSNCWLQHVCTKHTAGAAISSIVSEQQWWTREREVHTSTFVFQKLVGCGCCSTRLREAAQQTRATHHTHAHNILAFIELGREHLALSYRVSQDAQTHIRVLL